MRRSVRIPVFLVLTAVAASFASPPTLEWKRHATYDNNFLAASLFSFEIATDPSGDVFVAGYFGDSASVGGIALTSAGSADILLAKYASSGDVVWASAAGGPSGDEATSVAADALGNVVITGIFRDSASFDTQVVTSAGGWDVFVAKYDGNGDFLWARRGGGVGKDSASDIAVDPWGYCYVTGRFEGTAIFGGDTLIAANPISDLFLAKYDTTGNLVWAKQGEAATWSGGDAVATDPLGNVLLGGISSGTFAFGDSTLTENGTLIAKLDSSGAVQWIRQGLLGFTPNDIKSDGQGSCFLAGRHRGIDFGDTAFTQSTLYFEGYLVKWNSNGVFQWGHELSALDLVTEVEAHRIATNSLDEVWLTAHYIGSIGVGDTTLGFPNDTFAARFDTGGGFMCLLQQGGGGELRKPAIAVDDADNLFQLTFGDSIIVANRNAYFLSKWSAGAPTGIDDHASPMTRAVLYPNHPNPFNPSTTIRYDLPVAGQIEVSVYDISGAHVKTLTRAFATSGEHAITWNGHNSAGEDVASGVYFYQLRTATTISTRKMVLLK